MKCRNNTRNYYATDASKYGFMEEYKMGRQSAPEKKITLSSLDILTSNIPSAVYN